MLVSLLELLNWVGSANELVEWLWLSALPPSDKKQTNVQSINQLLNIRSIVGFFF